MENKQNLQDLQYKHIILKKLLLKNLTTFPIDIII